MRTCATCGASLEGRRPNARYCSDRCRWKRAYHIHPHQKAWARASARLRDLHPDEFQRLYRQELARIEATVA